MRRVPKYRCAIAKREAAPATCTLTVKVLDVGPYTAQYREAARMSVPFSVALNLARDLGKVRVTLENGYRRNKGHDGWTRKR